MSYLCDCRCQGCFAVIHMADCAYVEVWLCAGVDVIVYCSVSLSDGETAGPCIFQKIPVGKLSALHQIKVHLLNFSRHEADRKMV